MTLTQRSYTLLFLLLLVGLLFSVFPLPDAHAQTPLLEIDYNGATVFHVLNDGRLLLPTGAHDGYVLTADGDGFATWQAVSGSGGLSAVASDATLTGLGTTSNPLGVSVPLHLEGASSLGVVRGTHTNGHYGWLGGSAVAAGGRHVNGNIGYLGQVDYAVFALHGGGNRGYLGSSGHGAYGEHTNGHFGALGSAAAGAYGEHDNGNLGILGSGSTAVQGQNRFGHIGWLGYSADGAGGRHDNGNEGRLGTSDSGVYGMGSPWAGYFSGNVHVTGTLSKAGGAFKIDHHLAPANRYLSHSFVESPDMKNVYDGTVTTDAEGFATVTLPSYFEALNRDFRYQLTAIGTFAQAIVAEKIQDNHFVIRTDQPNVEVSWQVTGIRQDAWADENRIIVEADKPAGERGRYLHPRLYGRPERQGIGWINEEQALVDHETMRRQIDEQRRHMQAERQRLRNEQERR